MAEIAVLRPAELLADELAKLAGDGATGVLTIAGRPGGSTYLKDGYLVFAESPAVPDLGTRLVRSGLVTAEGWMRLSQAGEPGGALLAAGVLSFRELQRLAQSVAPLPHPGGQPCPPGRPSRPRARV